MQGKAVFYAMILGGVLGVPALGQSANDGPPPFPEFTFRTVRPPQAGHQGPRITIQIGDGTSEAPPPLPVPEAAMPESSGAGWFWSEVPAGLGEGAGRFDLALRHLAEAEEARRLPLMSAEALLQLAGRYDRRILQATIDTRVSPALVLAVIAVESAGQERAESPASAQGLMQLIPATAERFGVTDPFDADQNIAGGVAYLDWLMEEFDRDPILALAGYNAGEGAVRAAGGVPNFRETRDYIPRVLETWRMARLLCLTPPELPSDGCVFRTMLDG